MKGTLQFRWDEIQLAANLLQYFTTSPKLKATIRMKMRRQLNWSIFLLPSSLLLVDLAVVDVDGSDRLVVLIALYCVASLWRTNIRLEYFHFQMTLSPCVDALATSLCPVSGWGRSRSDSTGVHGVLGPLLLHPRQTASPPSSSTLSASAPSCSDHFGESWCYTWCCQSTSQSQHLCLYNTTISLDID